MMSSKDNKDVDAIYDMAYQAGYGEGYNQGYIEGLEDFHLMNEGKIYNTALDDVINELTSYSFDNKDLLLITLQSLRKI